MILEHIKPINRLCSDNLLWYPLSPFICQIPVSTTSIIGISLIVAPQTWLVIVEALKPQILEILSQQASRNLHFMDVSAEFQ